MYAYVYIHIHIYKYIICNHIECSLFRLVPFYNLFITYFFGSLDSGLNSPNQIFEKWASLITQLVKNPPAKQETLVQFLDWENPLEKG